MTQPLASHRRVTLVYGACDEDHNNAVVLAELARARVKLPPATAKQSARGAAEVRWPVDPVRRNTRGASRVRPRHTNALFGASVQRTMFRP